MRERVELPPKLIESPDSKLITDYIGDRKDALTVMNNELHNTDRKRPSTPYWQ